jgi:PAS domain
LFDFDPVAIYSCDASGVIQQFNRRAVELWGREPAPGDTNERFCGSFKLFRPDGSFMPHEQCPMAGVVAGKIPAAHDAEVVIERPDGSRVTVVVNICPLKTERGEITGAINCFYDITQRKQAEEALAQSHAQLQLHAEELIRFNRAAVGRELRMIELKKEINELCQRHGEAARYPLEFEEEGKASDG